MQRDREKLPAWQFQSTLLETLRSNTHVVICGETGCGKQNIFYKTKCVPVYVCSCVHVFVPCGPYITTCELSFFITTLFL